MAADYKELLEFTKKLEKLKQRQKDEFLESCCKELAARLLAKVIKRTPVGIYPHRVGGTLRRGWTAGKNSSAAEYANKLGVQHIGNNYVIDIVNPVEYAPYVEYGHRTPRHSGWVDGKFMLTISEEEIRNSSEAILIKKLKKYMKEVLE